MTIRKNRTEPADAEVTVINKFGMREVGKVLIASITEHMDSFGVKKWMTNGTPSLGWCALVQEKTSLRLEGTP